MFERLDNRGGYWKNMVRGVALRCGYTTKPLGPVGTLLGWDVWVCDGKAYLFRDIQCRRADWFEFCRMVRWLYGDTIAMKGG